MISLRRIQFLLAQGLGHEPSQEVWELISESPWPERLRSSRNLGRDVGNLVRWVQKFEGQRRRLPHRTREVPGDDRMRALSWILALEASQLREVVAFRKEVLRSRHLKPGEVVAWVERQEKKQGLPTFYATVQLNDTGELPRSLAAARKQGTLGQRIEALSYVGPNEKLARTAEVRFHSPLGRLKQLTSLLDKRFSFPEPGAVSFVLANVPPELGLARVAVSERHPFPARSRITLEVSPRLTPSEVAKLYQEARSGEMFDRSPSRVRSMSRDHTELAVFIARLNDGRTWEGAMTDWNRKHPKSAKKSVPAFTRAAHEAYARVTGERLDWKRGRGDREPKRSRGRRRS